MSIANQEGCHHRGPFLPISIMSPGTRGGHGLGVKVCPEVGSLDVLVCESTQSRTMFEMNLLKKVGFAVGEVVEFEEN